MQDNVRGESLLHGVGLLEGLLSGCSVDSRPKSHTVNSLIRVTFEIGATLSIEWTPVEEEAPLTACNTDSPGSRTRGEGRTVAEQVSPLHMRAVHVRHERDGS